MEIFTNNINLLISITLMNIYLSEIDAAFQVNQRSTVDKLAFWGDPKPTFDVDGRRAQKKKIREGEVPRVFHPVEQPLHETKRNNRKLHLVSDISQEPENIEDETLQGGGGQSTRHNPPSTTPSDNHEKNDLEENTLNPYSITKQMTRILQSFPNINVTIDTLGRTTEFNDIVLFKIVSLRDNPTFRSQKFAEDLPEKKILFIVHGLTVMGLDKLSCLTEENRFKILLGYYLEHLNTFDIYLIPVANPDGYAASKAKPYWNKNSSPQADCKGVNLDRNFDVMWNASHGLSSCSQLYPGPAAFSEAETKAVRDVFHYHSHKIIAYIHVHAGSYDTSSFKGDAILYPRGYTNIASDDDKYVDIKGEVDEAMRNASFRVLSVAVDTLNRWYGKVTGTSVDYASTVYGIPYAMEFVMQLYDVDFFASQDEEMYDYGALTEVWRRLINVVFKQLAKNVDIKPTDDMNTGQIYKRSKRGKRVI